MSARTGDPVKAVVPKSCMASRRIGTQAVPTDSNVLLVTSPAWPPVRCGRQGRAIVANHLRKFRVETLNVNTLKSLRGSGNTIPQESGCLLHSGDQILWWQLSHNQGQGHQVQALLVRK